MKFCFFQKQKERMTDTVKSGDLLQLIMNEEKVKKSQALLFRSTKAPQYVWFRAVAS